MKHNWCSTIRDKTISLCRCWTNFSKTFYGVGGECVFSWQFFF